MLIPFYTLNECDELYELFLYDYNEIEDIQIILKTFFFLYFYLNNVNKNRT